MEYIPDVVLIRISVAQLKVVSMSTTGSAIVWAFSSLSSPTLFTPVTSLKSSRASEMVGQLIDGHG